MPPDDNLACLPESGGRHARNGGLKLTALAIPDLVRLLARSGSRFVSEETIRREIVAGAPANADGTVNLIHYAAWLAKEIARRGD